MALGANAHLHDHDHGTYGRLWESDIGVVIHFMEYIVPINESWCGRYSQGTYEIGNLMSHHMRELKPTPRWGIGFETSDKENPLVVPIKASAKVLERKCFWRSPKGFWKLKQQSL